MNAAAITAFSTRAAATGYALWPAIVRIAGVEYAATVAEPRVLPTLISGGETDEGALIARVALAVLAEKPAHAQELQWKRPDEADWRTRKWWIAEVKRSPLDVEWVIACVPKN